jgi:hypothetical protein
VLDYGGYAAPGGEAEVEQDWGRGDVGDDRNENSFSLSLSAKFRKNN